MVGLAEGLIALMITPLLDRVLNPGKLRFAPAALAKLPFSGHVIYLNSFVPSGFTTSGLFLRIALIFLFLARRWPNISVPSESSMSGRRPPPICAIDVYEKLVRQPIGFFQQQPTGRLMSAVINDVERARGTLSETLALFFRYIFTLFFLVGVLLLTNWRMTLGSAIFLPLVLWPVSKLGRRIRRSVAVQPVATGRTSQILQETLSGNRVVKAFGMERFEIARFRERGPPAAARKHALDSHGRADFAADGLC